MLHQDFVFRTATIPNRVSDFLLNMAPGYKLYQEQNLVTVKYDYLEKYCEKSINVIVEELEWVASHKDSVVIDEPCHGRLIIYAKDDYSALEILLIYLEMQLLI